MYIKYKIEKKQVSEDNGATWYDVYPMETRNGASAGTYNTYSECVSGTPEPPITGDTSQYLTFDIVSGGTIVWKARTANAVKTISYSMDNGTTWTEITSSTAGTSFNVSAGDKVLFKGNNTSYGDINGYDYGSAFSGGTAYYNVYNNIMSLINADNFENLRVLTDNHTFHGLFYASNVINASGLILPATTLVNACYWGLFYNCTSLTTAPALPATTLTGSCYRSMFYNCTGLTTAPALPATTLADYCYQNMFFECHSLTTAPALPATTLANDCYASMFGRCYNLTSAPALPATAMTESCYDSMFSECTSLTSAPALPATTLANRCYSFMFAGCSGLTVAPALPATTLANLCYMRMFQNCTSLTSTPSILPATTLTQNCYDGMFYGCTSLTTAPELPATTLAQYCYANMFENCTSLTSAPVLPAITLVNFCYQGMFAGCTILSYIKCLATDISAPYCTSSWLNNVSSTGTFVKASNVTWPTGTSGIPSGWTVQNA